MSSDFDYSEFRQAFIEECLESLESLEAGLLELSQPDIDQAKAINHIFRAAHSIKGSSATFGFQDISDITHLMENTLSRARQAENALSAHEIDVMLGSLDTLRAIIKAYQQDTPADAGQISQTQSRLRALLHHPAESPATPSSPPSPAPPSIEASAASRQAIPAQRPEPMRYSNGRRGRKVESQSEQIARIRAEIASERTAKHQSKLPEPLPSSASALPSQFGSDATQPPPVPESDTDDERYEEQADQQSIRVNTHKIDSLINLLGELVITQSTLNENVDLEALNNAAVIRALHQLDRHTRELQDCVMKIRMVPLQRLFSQYPRMVRDLAKQLGKQVQLNIKGDSTELDKLVLEKLSAPLTQIIRNALDHGIEPPEQRRAKNKPEQGRLTVQAYYEGDQVVIDTRDDGEGIDKVKLWKQAQQMGLVSEQSKYSDNEVCNLIFHPGLSTKGKVNQFSGRGVGMDVAKRNITDIKGSVSAFSRQGEGTLIRIRLPLTLSILEGQLVKVRDEVFILPILSIVESLEIEPDLIKASNDGKHYYRYRQRFIPLYWLSEHLFDHSEHDSKQGGIVIVTESRNQLIGVVVDSLDAQQQTVRKSMEENYYPLPGFSGATILGDGRVALILDIYNLLFHRARRLPKPQGDTAGAA